MVSTLMLRGQACTLNISLLLSLKWIYCQHVEPKLIQSIIVLRYGMKSKFARKTLLLLVVVLVGVPLLAEAGIRFYFTKYGTPEEQIQYFATIEDIVANDGYIAMPYLNYVPAPNRGENNSRGFRGPEIAVPKEEGTFRIIAMGASSTYGWRMASYATAWPAQLQRILREQYGYSQVEVINAGVDGYSSHEALVVLSFRLLELEPDMIILYYGVTDINLRLLHPDDYTGLNLRRNLVDMTPAPLPSSALYRFIRVNYFDVDYQSKFSERVVRLPGVRTCQLELVNDDFMCTDFNMRAADILAANPPIYFENNMRNVVAIAQAHHIQVLLSTWAYFPDAGDFGVINFMAAEFRQAAIAEHNAIIRAIGADFDVPVYDLFNRMAYNPEFWSDGQHVNELGAQVQAQHYADFLVENALLPDNE
jgi:lysophospholipase L1-like esterase